MHVTTKSDAELAAPEAKASTNGSTNGHEPNGDKDGSAMAQPLMPIWERANGKKTRRPTKKQLAFECIVRSYVEKITALGIVSGILFAKSRQDDPGYYIWNVLEHDLLPGEGHLPSFRQLSSLSVALRDQSHPLTAVWVAQLNPSDLEATRLECESRELDSYLHPVAGVSVRS
jgi:hypothetical protein